MWEAEKTASANRYRHAPMPAGFFAQAKMDHLFRAVIAAPKEEIDRREKEWKRNRKRRKTVRR